MIVQWVRWHPRGRLILAGSEDSTVWMWNADRGVYLNMFAGHNSTVTCGDFTPDGNAFFFFCSEDECMPPICDNICFLR